MQRFPDYKAAFERVVKDFARLFLTIAIVFFIHAVVSICKGALLRRFIEGTTALCAFAAQRQLRSGRAYRVPNRFVEDEEDRRG